MGEERKYSDEQSAAILARTAELSAQSSAHSSGLTLDELERVAADAGLDPALVRKAAADVARGTEPARAPSWTTRWFGPTELKYEAEIQGEIDDDARQAILEAIHRALPAAGQVSTVGKLMTFTIADPTNGRALRVTVASDRGSTRIMVHERLGALMGGIYGGLGGGVGGSLVPMAGIGAGLALAPIAGPALAVAAGVATGFVALSAMFGGTRAVYLTAAGRRRRQAERAFEDVRAIVEERVRAPESALAEARARHGLTTSSTDASTAADAQQVQVDTQDRVVTRRRRD